MTALLKCTVRACVKYNAAVQHLSKTRGGKPDVKTKHPAAVSH